MAEFRIGERRYRLVRPSASLAILIAGTFLFLSTLGIWQLKRLEWKNDLLVKVEEASKGAPLPAIPAEIDLNALQFHRIAIRGQFMHDKEMHVGARYFQNKLGYYILTPVQLEDGRIVIVNRGWVPTELKQPRNRPQTQASTEANLIGIVRKAGDKNAFTPDNQPLENLWFWYDIPAMETFSAQTFLPFIIDVLGKQEPEVYPVPFTGEVSLRNDHLGYAITWFGLAMTCLIVGVAYHIRRI